MENKQKIYDQVCSIAFANIYCAAMQNNRIVLSSFDAKNKDHLFVLGVARGASGALQKDLFIECSWWTLRKLNKKIPKSMRMKRANKDDANAAINTKDLIQFVRDVCAQSELGEVSFADIYDEYYARRNK